MNFNRVILLGFTLRLLVAIWNGFFGPSFGAELDAQGFHQGAVEIAALGQIPDFKIGTMPYATFLSFFYWFTTDSLFIGSLLSCFIWVLSALFLSKILNLLSIDNRNKYLALLSYAILPSSILYTSVTLRESYQLLFVNIAVYSSLMLIIKQSYAHWFLLALGVVGAGLLHGALTAFSIFLITFTLLFLSVRDNKKIPWIKLILIAPFIIIVLMVGMNFFTENAYSLDNGISSSIETYQDGGIGADGRTNYKSEAIISGTLGLLFFLPVSVFQYLFEPMPWKISSVVDIPVLLENILRLWLIWIAIKGLRTASSTRYRFVLFILINYFVLETIWSLGTINWGTASRHHIPSIGMLLIVAFANRKLKKK